MNRWTRIPLLIGLSLTSVLLLNPAAELQACMSDDGCSRCTADCCYSEPGLTICGCRDQVQLQPPTTIVNFLSPRRAQITVPGYKTTHLQPSTDCVTAISPIEGIERVNSVTNHDSTTGRRFQEVSFFPAETPGREVAALAGTEGMPLGDRGTWFGFKSRITGTVADNLPNHFVIDVTLKPGVSPQDFVRALETQGVFATSSSTPDGVPNRGHHYFRRLTSTDVLVLLPERPERPEKPRP